MYEVIKEQINMRKEEKEQILILEDFNAKTGAVTEGTKTQVNY